MSTEKCDRCGETSKNTIYCKNCRTEHHLCTQCLDTYKVAYFCEDPKCFLKEEILRHGGARPGAGRPKKKDKKVQFSTRLRPDQITWLKAQDNIAQTLEELIDNNM